MFQSDLLAIFRESHTAVFELKTVPHVVTSVVVFTVIKIIKIGL